MAVSIETILARTSVRRFERRELDIAVVGRVRAIIAKESVPGPFGFAPRFGLTGGETLSNAGRVGTYGVIRAAPAFIVGAAMRSAGAFVDFGYRMEGIILEATAIGLGTCWLGGTFTRSAVVRLLPLDEDEVVPAVTPIGVPSGRTHVVGDLVKLAAASSTRRSFKRLFFDGPSGEPLTPERAGPWRTVLECVRHAPSARNRQPWRIVLERQTCGDRLHLFIAGERWFEIDAQSRTMHHLDMGIAMRHVTESAEALGIAGRWGRVTDPVRPADETTIAYVASWLP